MECYGRVQPIARRLERARQNVVEVAQVDEAWNRVAFPQTQGCSISYLIIFSKSNNI